MSKTITNPASYSAKYVIEQFGEGQYLKGKTAIVTGGNSGIGLETVKALALAGCRVILCSRSVKAGETAIQDGVLKIGESGDYAVTSPDIVVKALDLNSLASVKAFADDFLASEPSARIDFLVLNAGIMALPSKETTVDGFEKQMGVNHFGHAYLIRLLLPFIHKQGMPARVVSLASSAHDIAQAGFTADLNGDRKGYSGWPFYGNAKSANLLYARALDQRLKGKSQIVAVSLHPGVIQTNLWRQSWLNRLIGMVITSKTVPQGAATTVWACVCPRVETDGVRGSYLQDSGPAVPSTALCRDEGGAATEELWVNTELLLAKALAKSGLPALAAELL